MFITFKVTTVLCLVMNCCFSSNNIIERANFSPSTKNVHAFIRNHHNGKKSIQNQWIWSEWSTWSECSRSCGGGVKIQTRSCIYKSTGNLGYFREFHEQRRNSSRNNVCIGMYKRIHLCNTQDCPFGSKDFRYVQCASFNSKKFRGRTYRWQPFIRIGEECALNCRPSGMNFFATLNKTVIDGTPCFNPIPPSGKLVLRRSKGVCVAGICKAFDSRGVVGSSEESATSECPACTKGFCRSISGIYTRSNLPPGYSLVAKIPKGACRIHVQQLKHSKNFIAIRSSEGSFLINGDYRFSPTSHSFHGVGTIFEYTKQDSLSLESVSSPGPLEADIEIHLVTYQPNLGIKYGYLLPNEPVERQIAPPSVRILKRIPDIEGRADTKSVNRKNIEPNQLHQHDIDNNQHHHHRQRRLRRFRFSWKVSGISACSKTCGGGIQTTVVSCVRELTQTPVPDKRCNHLEKPMSKTIACNNHDCSIKWKGIWGTCSVSCGSGMQKYILQCTKELNNGQEIELNDIQCSRLTKPMIKTRICVKTPCDVANNEIPRNFEVESTTKKESQAEWKTGDWSACSVTCGTGHRFRSVTCLSNNCQPEFRPNHAEYCTLPSCIRTSTKTTEISPWLVTEWSKCSEECGAGKQIRHAVCGKNTCDISSKPEVSRDCLSEKQCDGKWFVGPWGECIDSCTGDAHQNREVLCVVKLKGHNRLMNDMTCSDHSKPPTTRPCKSECAPFWFIGEWTICENCPNGIQKRQVRCMNIDGIPSSGCHETEVPPSKRSCDCYDRKKDKKYIPAHDQPIENSCVDKIRNCYLTVQARLCQYPYYKSQCCQACRNAQRDQVLQ